VKKKFTLILSFLKNKLSFLRLKNMPQTITFKEWFSIESSNSFNEWSIYICIS